MDSEYLTNVIVKTEYGKVVIREQANKDMIEVCYLEDNDEPHRETFLTIHTFGREKKVCGDCGTTLGKESYSISPSCLLRCQSCTIKNMESK